MFSEKIDAFFKDALSFEEAQRVVPCEAIMPFNPNPECIKKTVEKPYTEIEPLKAYDNVYWVGTNLVGAFVIDTGDGYVLLDCGWGTYDCRVMVSGMKKLGLDPSKIRCILVSHEHGDHYGGVNYLIREICPDAKVAMGQAGWNFLQCAPLEFAYVDPRPERIDLALTDLMKFKVGNYPIMAVLTPGHSPGCMSFIFPVSVNGQWHMAGLMGGTAVWPNYTELRYYACSIEYFKIFTDAAGCDIGLGVHRRAEDIDAARKQVAAGEIPWYFPGEDFSGKYLQGYRGSVARTLASGAVAPYMMPVGPDGKARAERKDE